MINLYYGFDNRESIGAAVFQHSVVTRSSHPVAFIPLHLDNMKRFYTEDHTDGSNDFIYSRFLIPYLQGYTGWAIFMDGSDMLCQADIAELWKLRDPFNKAVQVVKHNYVTKQNRKYVGTEMEADNEDYPRKNWSSVMLINCGHYAWRQVTPEFVQRSSGSILHRFAFMTDDEIGELPKEWNHLVRENDKNSNAKIVHFTQGIPAFAYYSSDEFAENWFNERAAMEWSSPNNHSYVIGLVGAR